MTMTQPLLSLSLSQTVRAPRAVVYAAWTKPETLRRWFVRDTFSLAEAEMDVRPGGQYRLVVADTAQPDTPQVITGAYTEVVPDTSLRFTFRSKGEETQVTLELASEGGTTRLHLQHSGILTPQAAEHHRNAWRALLARLAADYTRELEIAAPPDKVLAALTSIPGLAQWWTSDTTGDAGAGGEIRFGFKGGEARMRVARADGAVVEWDCLGCLLPDWVGTRVQFELVAGAPGSTLLRFHHQGLLPAIDCYASCEQGWNRYLGSLQSYLETGKGWPLAI